MKWICEKCGINIEACTKWTCIDQIQHKWKKASGQGVRQVINEQNSVS